MKYYLIAGEASGDLHGSRLVRELRRKDADADIRAWGGDLMQEAGATLVKHIRDLAFMGFFEVLRHLKTIRHNMDFCRKDIRDRAPDVLVLIDYPGFNLRMAAFAKEIGIPVYYYISPKIWAWKKGRFKKIRAYVDRMYVIFPFETDFYKNLDYPVEFYGNPVVDAVSEFSVTHTDEKAFKAENELDERPVIALLAGSRKQEIRYNLPMMVEMQKAFPAYQFVLAAVNTIEPEYYHQQMKHSPVKMLRGKTYEILRFSTAALVTSGTATLETALFNVPQIVCYRANPLSIALGRLIIKLSWISLVNLNMNREVVRELIQGDMNKKNLETELRSILPGGENREVMLKDYTELREVMGKPGASERVAKSIVEHLSSKN